MTTADGGDARTSDRIGATAAANTVGRIAMLALVSLFTFASARFLLPDDRGEVVFAVQSAYLIGGLLLVGAERSVLVGALHPLRSRWWPAVQFGIGVVVPIAVATALSGSPTWLFTPSIALSTCVTRLSTARAVFLRDRRTILRLQFGTGLVMALGVVVLAAAGVDSTHGWLLCFALATALAPLWSMLVDGVERTAGGATAPGARRADLMVADAATVTVQRADRVVLGASGNSTDLGTYALAGSVTEIVSMPLTSLANVASRPGERLSSRHVLPAAGVVAAGLVVLVAGVGDRLLRAIGGGEYEVGLRIWVPLCLASLLMSTARVLTSRLLSSGDTSGVAVTEVAGGVVALVLFVSLVPALSSVAAAWSTCAAYAVTTLAAVRRHRVTRECTA